MLTYPLCKRIICNYWRTKEWDFCNGENQDSSTQSDQTFQHIFYIKICLKKKTKSAETLINLFSEPANNLFLFLCHTLFMFSHGKKSFTFDLGITSFI